MLNNMKDLDIFAERADLAELKQNQSARFPGNDSSPRDSHPKAPCRELRHRHRILNDLSHIPPYTDELLRMRRPFLGL